MIALMYHDIVPGGAEDSSGFPGRDAALYKVTPETFDAHLAAIDDPPEASRHADWEEKSPRRQPRESPVFTFDDGGISALFAADELERHGRRGCFFMTANYIGVPGFLDARDLRDLHSRGHVVGSHSCSHPLRMGHCSDGQLLDEWKTSHARLSDILGDEVRVASVPGGDYAPRVAESAAAAGFTQLFTSEPTAAVASIGSIAVNGRFTIQKWTTADTVAGLARGAWLPCSRQALLWTAKKVGKQMAGGGYLRIRRLLLRHGAEVRWGDQTADLPTPRTR